MIADLHLYKHRLWTRFQGSIPATNAVIIFIYLTKTALHYFFLAKASRSRYFYPHYGAGVVGKVRRQIIYEIMEKWIIFPMRPKSTYMEFYIKTYDQKPKVCSEDYRSALGQASTLNLILKGLEIELGSK